MLLKYVSRISFFLLATNGLSGRQLRLTIFMPKKKKKTRRILLAVITRIVFCWNGMVDLSSWSRLSDYKYSSTLVVRLTEGFNTTTKGNQPSKWKLVAWGRLYPLLPRTSSLVSVTSASHRKWAPDLPLHFPPKRFSYHSHVTLKYH